MTEYDELLDKYHEERPEEEKGDERLEIPKPRTHIQGGKTFIKNYKKITSTLRREPKHLLKYLSKELATSGNIEGDRVVLKGKFKSYQVQDKLSGYIKKYVICDECKKADTKLVKFKGTEYKKCEACGARSPVESL